MSRLVKSSVIYTFGSLLRQVVSFLMLPIYTRHLTPSDYGIVEMLYVINSVLALIAGTHIGLATIRFFHATTSEDEQRTVLSTATFTILMASASVYLVFLGLMQTPLGGHLASGMLGDANLKWLLALFSLSIVFQPIEEQMFTVMRLENRAWAFIGLSTAKLALQLGLNILFVVTLDLKAPGVVYGGLIASGTFALLSFGYTRIYSGWRFSPAISRRLLIFVFPLMIGAFGSLYMSVSDRYVLQSMHDTAAVGLYSLGARFADILMVVGWWPFINIWQTHRFEIAKTEGAERQYRDVFSGVTIYLVWIALGIAVLTDNVRRLMATESFWPASAVTPPLLIASLLAAAVGFCNFSFMLKDKTSYIAKSTWASAIALTVAYVALVPPFGAQGAAWAKVTAGGAQLIATLYWSRSIYPMHLPWRNAGILLGLAAVLFWLAEISKQHLGDLALLAELPLLAAFPILALYAPLLPAELRAWLQANVKELVNKGTAAISVLMPKRSA
jgi:O-antigen/teichoic acid export membrane protein